MILGPIGQGKLWEVIEMAAMVAAGCILSIRSGNKDIMFSVAGYGAVSFISGKIAYGATRGLLQHAELFSMMTDRFIGGAVALLVSSYVGKKLLDVGQDGNKPLPYLISLVASTSIGLLGIGLREIA
ncbi:MAG TPA: hypothetical protein VHK67_07655 [Rhabdochlamydiaceae bacterium]|jgi:hypothetical protein|nr:hypothetical protein [Rhabdochlamydiaceae bacterium]